MTGPRFIAAIASIGFAAVLLIASSGTPPSGSTGAPGAGNCRSCHGTFPLNSGTAGFFVTAPATVRPGQSIPVTVRFIGGVGARYGFSMVAKDAANATLGTWAITDTVGTQTINNGNEVGHKNASSQNTWTMNWVAPATLNTATVTYYACGVDGNGSGSSNDYVFTTSTTITAQRLALTVSSSSQSYSMTLAGGATLAGQEYQVLATTVSVAGPVFGLMPDSLFWGLLAFPYGVPGIHFSLDAAGNSAASYPPGTLAALAGIPLRFVAFTRNASQTVTGVSNVVSVTP